MAIVRSISRHGTPWVGAEVRRRNSPLWPEAGSCTNRLFVYAIVASIALLTMIACGGQDDPQRATTGLKGAEQVPVTESALSDTARAGEELFNANCSVCHGVGATGTTQGPPLIDRIYQPGHHPDFSIRNAVRQGVKQHHWVFGDMAPVAGVSSDDVEKIICYIREKQRADGIFEGDAFSTVC